MDPIAIIRLLSNFAIFVPPPWGPILAGLGKVLPLIEEGIVAYEAVQKADPSLVPHLQQVAQDVFGGLSVATVAKQVFAPHQMTQDEKLTSEEQWFKMAQGEQG